MMLSIVPFALVLAFFGSVAIPFRTMLVLALAGASAVRVATTLDKPLKVPEPTEGPEPSNVHAD